MRTLDDSSLDDVERKVVEQLAEALRDRFGDRMLGLWLYGSSARGERRHEFSDVDLMVIVDEQQKSDENAAHHLAWDLVFQLDADWPMVSVRVRDRAWLADRRAIDAFFIQEIDRDRIVVTGEAV